MKEVLHSPVSGIVSALYFKNEELVQEGDTVAEIEIMKMLYNITAGLSGKINFLIKPGEMINENQIIAEIYDSTPRT